jgi:hypothetical protein
MARVYIYLHRFISVHKVWFNPTAGLTGGTPGGGGHSDESIVSIEVDEIGKAKDLLALLHTYYTLVRTYPDHPSTPHDSLMLK